MTDLNGKTALVTGASQGIGRAIAETMAQRGANIVLVARNHEKLEAVVAKLTDTGATARAAICDVTRYEDVKAAVDLAIDTFGKLDILVNNAGTIDPISRLSESDPALWARAVDVNVKGVYYGLRAALPHMIAQKSGTIINISSGAANSALEGWSHYCSTKVAAKKLTECAHKEVSETGVIVVGLSPGTVATDMMARIKASGINPVSQLDWSTHIPPAWVGEAVAYLCGPGGARHAGTDFSIKTDEGRREAGLPLISA